MNISETRIAKSVKYGLRLAAVGGIAFSQGCGADGDSQGATSTPQATLENTGVVLTQDPAGDSRQTELFENTDITKYYPELREAGFDIMSSGTFLTKKGTEVAWYNYTDYAFHEGAAEELLSYMQNLVPPESVPQQVAYMKFDGTVVTDTITISPEDPKKKRVIFLLPEEAKGSSWVPSYPDGAFPTGGTRVFPDNVIVSYVRALPTLDSPFVQTHEDNINRTLAVVACQGSITIDSSIPELEEQARDIFCNSVGDTVLAKQNDQSFRGYEQIASHTRYNALGSNMIVYLPEAYEIIPSVGSVIVEPKG